MWVRVRFNYVSSFCFSQMSLISPSSCVPGSSSNHCCTNTNIMRAIGFSHITPEHTHTHTAPPPCIAVCRILSSVSGAAADDRTTWYGPTDWALSGTFCGLKHWRGWKFETMKRKTESCWQGTKTLILSQNNIFIIIMKCRLVKSVYTESTERIFLPIKGASGT